MSKFKINPNPTFTADVKLTEPGKVDPTVVKMTFRYKNRDDIVEFGKSIEDKPFAEILPDIIVGWEGIDVDCTPENIALLVKNYTPAGWEILNAYYGELSASRAKN